MILKVYKMLHFFPEPYEDEIFYSIVARYHYYADRQSLRNTIKDLFGNTTRRPVFFPNNLNYLANQLYNNALLASDYFIEYHTLLPLYHPFITTDKNQELKSLIKKDITSLSSINSLLKKSNIYEYTKLRYCPICISEDKDRYEEAYFHRIHQVQGVVLCPKHVCILEVYPASSRDLLRGELVRLDSRFASTHPRYENDIKLREQLFKISDMANHILCNVHLELNLQTTLEAYLHKLSHRNLLLTTGKINKKVLLAQLTEFWSEKLLGVLGINSNYDWIRAITSGKKDTVLNPMKHILIVLFLFESPYEFFSTLISTHSSLISANNHINISNLDKTTNQIFGKGPWPCLNPATDHYKENVINACTIYKNYSSKTNYGLFTCDCGYSYFGRCIENGNGIEIIKYRVKDYGKVWEEALRNYIVNDSIDNTYALAKMLDCDHKTILSHAERLGLLDKLKNSSSYKNKANTSRLSLKQNNLIKFKNALLKIIDENPGITRKRIKNIARYPYCYLFKNDPEWFEKNMPKTVWGRSSPYISDKNGDWEDFDEKLLAQLVAAHLELLNKSKPVRVTYTRLCDMVAKRTTIYENLYRLPKTREFLNSVIETIEDFQIRRLRKVCEDLYIERGKLHKSYIVAKAGLTRGYSDKVKKEIDNYIDCYNDQYKPPSTKG